MWRARVLLALAAGATFCTPAGACTISSTGVAFGAYDTRATGNDDSGGTINVSCHPSVNAPIVQLGTGQSGTYSTREMSGGAWTLSYNLYVDPTRTTIWGDGSGGSIAQTLSGGNVTAGERRFSRTVYGRIPGQQNVGAGSYGDTIVMTVTF